jgi:hypothetical protein
MDSLKTQTKNWLIQGSTENIKNDQTKIVESLIDNNFSDHPKAKKRLKNLSEIIEEINLPEEYLLAISDDDFKQAKKIILKQ